MKILIRLCLQLALVCYSGFVVAVEPLYVLGLKGTFVGDDLSGDLVLSKYDFAKNTWKDYIFDSEEVFLELAYFCPIYVYGSRVYCLIKEIKNYTLYIFDRDLNLLTHLTQLFKV